MANKKNHNRKGKRKFRGNFHTSKVVSEFCSTGDTSGVKKIQVMNKIIQKYYDLNDFYFIMHFKQLKLIFEKYSCCQICTSKLEISHNMLLRKGFSLSLKVKCIHCDNIDNFFTSPVVNNEKCGNKPHEVNTRSLMAFREIGCGRESMIRFAIIMNMPPPMTYRNINRGNDELHIAYQKAAIYSMTNSAMEVRQSLLKLNNDSSSLVDCSVSVDGSWQKRGYSSLNGVVAVVAHKNKKVIDTYVMSKFCKSCEIWNKKKNSLKFDEWKLKHICQINHSGSAGSMEAAGAIEIFSSSVQKYKLRYAKYLGDGDTSSFTKVVESKPYGD